MYEIVELTEFREEYVGALDALMGELSEGAGATEERVKGVIEDPNMHQYAAVKDGRIVGCATLCVCRTPEMVVGFVEAVVVAAECRGEHLGRGMMERVVEDARALGVRTLHLTSNPRRVAANGLYRSMGFGLYDTNCYKMRLL